MTSGLSEEEITKVINDILADPDMPEHMVTVRDDEQMRALLEKHLRPLSILESNLRIYKKEAELAIGIRRENRYDIVTGEWLGPDPEPGKEGETDG